MRINFDADTLLEFRSARNVLPICYFSSSYTCLRLMMGARTEFVRFYFFSYVDGRQ